MRAITFSEFGGPEVLEVSDVDLPTPAAGQIRVAVRAAGVNPYDWKLRRGLMGGSPPKRVGLEFAGVVDALGDGVDDVAVADAVYGFAIGGAAAEFTRAAHYGPIPDGLDFVTAAALPVAVETAYRVLDQVGVAAGSTLLVNGASGTVGQTIVQVAASRGVHVIGTASEANQARVRELGAEPVSYGPGLVDRVHALGVGMLDGAIDAAGGDALGDLVTLADGPEHVVTIADYAGAEALGVTFSGENSAFYGLGEIATLLATGAFSPPPVRTFALDEVAAAQELSETGHPGAKLVLTI